MTISPTTRDVALQLRQQCMASAWADAALADKIIQSALDNEKTRAGQFIHVERGDYHIGIDEKDGLYRVICNGAVLAHFVVFPVGEITALKDAVAYLETVEARCLANPKPQEKRP